MTEGESRQWIVDRFGVSRETSLNAFAILLVEEAGRQNLVSPASLPHLWERHFLDSAQLISLAPATGNGKWIDIGTGAGMPGLVVAILTDWQMTLVEPRARRAVFLQACAEQLGVNDRVNVVHAKIERVVPSAPASVISARAVAALDQLLAIAQHCADSSTTWLLPKGQSAHSEVEAAQRKWQGSFHVEPSLTQAESGIVVARGVRPK